MISRDVYIDFLVVGFYACVIRDFCSITFYKCCVTLCCRLHFPLSFSVLKICSLSLPLFVLPLSRQKSGYAKSETAFKTIADNSAGTKIQQKVVVNLNLLSDDSRNKGVRIDGMMIYTQRWNRLELKSFV